MVMLTYKGKDHAFEASYILVPCLKITQKKRMELSQGSFKW